MPFLPISKSAIESPTKYDLAMIEAVMLFPENEKERTLFERAAAADAAVEIAEREQVHAAVGDAFARLLRFVHESPRISDIRESRKFKRRALFGVVAGELLTETLARRRLHPNSPSRAPTLKRAASVLKKHRISKATITNTIWPRYACVSHLWAAYLARANSTGISIFPCQISDIPFFLGRAEANRIEAESYRIKQARHPVLDGRKTWRVPDGIELPAIDSEFKSID